MTRLHRDESKVRVQVCRGIMCSTGGGGRSLEAVFERALLAAGVLDNVELFCPSCMGACADGPCVRIGGQKFLHVTPEDVHTVFVDTISHRLLLAPEAEARNISAARLLQEILRRVPTPRLR